ncbi:LytTR family DNA-binding domain-containing protein [Flavobacterium sp.]|uniref:LytR/AlgR family response regulator transcription factor n=1 Tax=Flavobacterium sp. TaxID=239 RepID=UPI0025BBB3C0|nr:LytTR family DNA-binding domain-containing protein [Flavobacterium sp.]
MKNFTFVIIDDDHKNRLKTKATAESFSNLHFLAMADNYDDGIDIVLEHNPDVIFLEIDPLEKESNLSLALINELYRYLSKVPKVIVTTKNDSLCLNAFKYGVFDYLINPIETKEVRKTIFRLDKELESNTVIAPKTQNPVQVSNVNPVEIHETVATDSDEVVLNELVEESISEELIENDLITDEYSNDIIESEEVIAVVEDKNTDVEDKSVTLLQTENTKEKPLIICVKSYGDYRYIEAKDICYLQADNNSTDIHLNTGEMITAFKTLKHFEGLLTYPFVRIHNSYIVNIDYVSRIHTGNAVCHIKNTTTKLPFSKSYKENIDAIIATIASGNYLEI